MIIKDSTMEAKVLFVDDEENAVNGYRRNLRKEFDIDIATSGAEALEALWNKGPYAVIVSDMQMPNMNGVELLSKSMKVAPNTVRVMLTGNLDQQTAIDAVNDGSVFQFVNKPCSVERLSKTLTQATRQYKLLTAEQELLENTLNGSIKTLLDILAMIDPQSFAFSQKLKAMVQRFCQCFDIDESWELELASMMSNIGKVTIPTSLTQKIENHETLTPEEEKVINKSPELSYNLIANIPRLKQVAKIVLYQNKNFDGTGFPEDGVKGEELPKGSRILKILSDILQLEATGVTKAEAIDQMQQSTGKYDIQILTAAACGLEEEESENYTTAEVTLSELKPGQILMEDLLTHSDTLILAEGNELTYMHIQKIRNFSEITRIKLPILVRIPTYAT